MRWAVYGQRSWCARPAFTLAALLRGDTILAQLGHFARRPLDVVGLRGYMKRCPTCLCSSICGGGRCSGGGDILNEGGGSNSDGGGGSAGALADLDMRRHRRRVTERSAALAAATDCRIWKVP